MPARVSVITVVKNAESVIGGCMESVLSQDYPAIEYIVIDGASTDGTREIIRQKRDQLYYHISEPDQGISDAFNKGVAAAAGEYIIFLNADDRLVDHGAISRLSEFMERPDAPDLLFGAVAYQSIDGRLCYLEKPAPSRIWKYMSVYHPSSVIRRELFLQIGNYDRSFRYAMDSEWFHRAIRKGARIETTNEPIALMSLGGVSDRKFAHSLMEFRRSAIRHGGGWCNSTFWFLRQLVVHLLLRVDLIKRWRLSLRTHD